MIRTKVKDETKKVARLAAAATITTLPRAGAYIRGIAMRSLGKGRHPSPPGRPPNSGTGRLRNAIIFEVEKGVGVVIGPARNAIGGVGNTHEFGGTEHGRGKRTARFHVGGRGPVRVGSSGPVVARLATPRQVARAQEIAGPAAPTPQTTRHYPPRPFMGRALELSRERLPNFWKNSLKGD